MRKNIVAGNWKMNNDLAATKTLISELLKKEKTANAEVMIAPTFVNLLEASKLLKDSGIIGPDRSYFYGRATPSGNMINVCKRLRWKLHRHTAIKLSKAGIARNNITLAQMATCSLFVLICRYIPSHSDSALMCQSPCAVMSAS